MWKNRLLVITTQTFALGKCKYFLFSNLGYCFCYCFCVCNSLENTTPRNLEATFIFQYAYFLLFFFFLMMQNAASVFLSCFPSQCVQGFASLACSFYATSSAVYFSPSNLLGCSLSLGLKRRFFFFFFFSL